MAWYQSFEDLEINIFYLFPFKSSKHWILFLRGHPVSYICYCKMYSITQAYFFKILPMVNIFFDYVKHLTLFQMKEGDDFANWNRVYLLTTLLNKQ